MNETLLAVALVGALLIVGSVLTVNVRQELREERTWELLAMLDEAVRAYHGATGSWPEIPPAVIEELPADPRERTLEAMDALLAVLLEEPASVAVLEKVPAMYRVADEDDDGAWFAVTDAWGRRIACLTAASGSGADRHAAEARGRCIFVSAGMDGELTSSDFSAEADNLRSDEEKMPLRGN